MTITQELSSYERFLMDESQKYALSDKPWPSWLVHEKEVYKWIVNLSLEMQRTLEYGHVSNQLMSRIQNCETIRFQRYENISPSLKAAISLVIIEFRSLNKDIESDEMWKKERILSEKGKQIWERAAEWISYARNMSPKPDWREYLEKEKRLQRKWDENPFPLLYYHFKGMFNYVEGEPEFELFFKDIPDTYMIIKYSDGVSFQRCSEQKPGSGEVYYGSLDELYEAHSIDGICLKESWDEITDIIVNGTYSAKDDSREIRDKYHIPDSVLCTEEPRVCPIINKLVYELDCYEFIVGCTDTPQYKYYSKWNNEEMREICDKCIYNAYW